MTMPTVKECEWFLHCHNEVAAEVEHPTLGWVPICADHVDWLQTDPSPTKWVPPLAAKHGRKLQSISLPWMRRMTAMPVCDFCGEEVVTTAEYDGADYPVTGYIHKANARFTCGKRGNLNVAQVNGQRHVIRRTDDRPV